VAGAGHCALGLEAHAPQGVARVVLDLPPVGRAHLLPERFRRGQAFGPVEGVLTTGKPRRGERDRLARGDGRCQPGLQPPGGLARQPAAAGVAMDAQETCPLPAVLGLSRRQPGEPRSPRLCLAVVCMVSARLEGGRIFTHRRDRMAPGWPSGRDVATWPQRIPYLCTVLNQNSYNSGVAARKQ
jgi:hypothetical protein